VKFISIRKIKKGWGVVKERELWGKSSGEFGEMGIFIGDWGILGDGCLVWFGLVVVVCFVPFRPLRWLLVQKGTEPAKWAKRTPLAALAFGSTRFPPELFDRLRDRIFRKKYW